MKHVLIWKKLSPGSEYDIYRSIDCKAQYAWSLQNGTFNVGNRLWLQGIMTAIDTGENCYEFLPDSVVPDEINNRFDFIILPMANIFHVRFVNYLESMADTFEKIRIPIYVIACGAQAESYDALTDLTEKIGESAKRFIRAVYQTGGEFALRGHFTKRFFDALGFPDAVVTGCPSLYQFGSDFTVPVIDPNAEIRPIFNGQLELVGQLLEEYPQSYYLDQDAFLSELYAKRQGRPDLRQIFAFYCNYGPYAAELLAQDRIKLIPDMYNWRRFIAESGANFSFGSRIHGSIISLLSGVPATVLAIDTRTMEMADFFEIPYIKPQPGHVYTKKELEQAYVNADYGTFNDHYKAKYEKYAGFLTTHGIVSKPNAINRFFTEEKTYFPPEPGVNTDYYRKAAKSIRNSCGILKGAKSLRERIRK